MRPNRAGFVGFKLRCRRRCHDKIRRRVILSSTGCALLKLGRIHNYEVIIYWSREDNAYIAEVPELAGCAAHGSSQEDALRNAQEATALWLETAQEFGDPIPEPKGPGLFSPEGQQIGQLQTSQHLNH